MILDIQHRTEYHFDASPHYGLQQIRLYPQSGLGQIIQSWEITVQGGTVESVFNDHHHNRVYLVSLEKGAKKLTLLSQGRAHMQDQNGILGAHTGFTPLWLYQRSTYLTTSGQGVKALAKFMSAFEGTDLEMLHALSKEIGKRVTYETGQTDSMTTAEEAIKARAGVCQDHSHIFISAARFSGFPARYVSGYLMVNDRIAQEATHAWAEVHIDDLGWVGFDVSNQISPDARYVRVATGLDYSDAAPISGLTLGGHNESISVNVQVQQ